MTQLVLNRLFLLCSVGLASIRPGECAAFVQPPTHADSEYERAATSQQSENFFSMDEGLKDRLQNCFNVKIYDFGRLKSDNARAHALKILDYLMYWNYPELRKQLSPPQVAVKVLRDFRECREYYQEHKQDSVRNQEICRLLAAFSAVKKALGQ